MEIACLDCYCTNLENNEALRNAGNRLIGRAHALLREAGPDPSFLPSAHARLKDVDERIMLMASLTTTMEDLRNLNLTLQQLNIDDASFMEVLINGIRNDVISYQAFVFKTLAMCRLHTAILDRPPSSAATMEVQGPDTKGMGILGILFLACQWCMGTICIL